VPRPRPEIRVTFSPQDGELHVEGDLEAVKRFMEWYLDMSRKLQQAQAGQQVQQSQQGQGQPKPEPQAPARQEKVKPKPQHQKAQPEATVDTTGLPSFAQDNPWIGILSKKH
jgi:hypothetical protein